MGLTFPTTNVPLKNWPAPPGEPTRARHCRCAAPLEDSDDPGSCIRCGHYTMTTINRTWRRRAAELAEKTQARRAA